jgi:Tfp pilus assembly protein PilN
MNMIRINFIPQEARREKGNIWADGFGSLPREVVFGIFVAAGAVLVALHILLAGLALARVAQHTMLNVRWDSLAPKKKVLDDAMNEIKAVQAKMSAVKVITDGQGVVWAALLNEISDSVPNGLWIREIRFVKGDLMVEGSAVSKVKNEMIIVNDFAASLKEKTVIRAGFTGIDIESIEERKNSVQAIADFLLKAKRRTP